MSDEKTVLHSKTGNYTIAELLPEGSLDWTLEQVLTLLAAHIVDRPDDVRVHVVNEGRIKLIEFEIHTSDMAQLLGSKGYTAYALRTISKAILGALVKKCSYRVNVSHDQDGRG